MTVKGTLRPLEIAAGVQGVEDRTALATEHYTAAKHIRFDKGVPQKLGGWVELTYRDTDVTISGVVRMIWSAVIQTVSTALIGTNSNLYNLKNGALTNITPLQTTTIAAPNSLATHYNTLANNPISTTNGSNMLVVADTQAALFQVGDSYTLSGATGFNGISAGTINTTHVIRAIGTNTIHVHIGTTANATGSGGGNAVVRSSGLITMTVVGHGLSNGARIKVNGAANTGGILNTQINVEQIIRNVTANTFDFLTGGTATSSASSGGGASITFQEEIAPGAIDQSASQGYGAGLYGAGLYGTSLVSNAGISYPRLWSADRYGDIILVTPGNQGGLYEWDGNTAVAPVQVGGGAPTAINYLFVSNNILVTFGKDNVGNRIAASDQGSGTNNGYNEWTASALNQVFTDDIEGAGTFISHAPVIGQNLIYTANQTWRMRYIGRDAGVWEIEQVSSTVGIIAQNARVSINGIAYWMGQNNFYMWDGSRVNIIPANTQRECTIKNKVFDNLNRSQASKCFAWYNAIFDEVWFHYPTNTNECDSVARVSIKDYSWVPDEFDRTAAEYPVATLLYPRLADLAGTLYYHEVGVDDNGAGMEWYLTSNLQTIGKKTAMVNAVVPDNYQTGEIALRMFGKLWPQSTDNTADELYALTGSTERVQVSRSARYYQYTISGDALGQRWRAGAWQEEVQPMSNE